MTALAPDTGISYEPVGNTELMKLCCVQLFNAGFLADVLLIWQAKECKSLLENSGGGWVSSGALAARRRVMTMITAW